MPVRPPDLPSDWKIYKETGNRSTSQTASSYSSRSGSNSTPQFIMMTLFITYLNFLHEFLKNINKIFMNLRCSYIPLE